MLMRLARDRSSAAQQTELGELAVVTHACRKLTVPPFLGIRRDLLWTKLRLNSVGCCTMSCAPVSERIIGRCRARGLAGKNKGTNQRAKSVKNRRSDRGPADSATVRRHNGPSQDCRQELGHLQGKIRESRGPQFTLLSSKELPEPPWATSEMSMSSNRSKGRSRSFGSERPSACPLIRVSLPRSHKKQLRLRTDNGPRN